MYLRDRDHLLAEVHALVAVHVDGAEAADNRAGATLQVRYRRQFALVRTAVVLRGSIAKQLLQLKCIQRVKAVGQCIAGNAYRSRRA
ncbi:MAG: hypothetical protein H6556_18680 [Lewinellaceae bacterium]|nr:hypothetical protein [Lewinellaceae bacterium]